MDRRRFLSAGAAAIATTAGTAIAQTSTMQPQEGVANPLPGSQTGPIEPLASLNDLEAMAAKVLPAGVMAHVRGGSGNEWTLQENLRAYERVRIKPNYLSDSAKPDLRIRLLKDELALPIFTCPMGSHGIIHATAEEGTARGTSEAGALMLMSSAANRTVEQVAAASHGPRWLQIYITPDQAVNRQLLENARAAGFTAVVVTIDAPAAGRGDESIRLAYRMPATLPKPYLKAGIKNDLGWRDVEMVQRVSGLPVLIKGVLTPELAREGMERGMAGVIVSNHGGRQIDGLPASLDALPAIAKAVDKRGIVMLDGGIRRGSDVFKALASGAHAVGIGRPILYGLALGGWQGVNSVYARLRQELAFTMNVAGVSRIDEISSRYLWDQGALRS